MKLWLTLLTAIFLAGCGNRNSFDCKTPLAGIPCAERTKDEDARMALNNGDMETAVNLLKELVAAEPETYSRYPLLGAALAGRSGFDVFNVVKGNFGGETSLLETMNSFLPTPASKGAAYDSSLADMKASVAILNAVPAALRTNISSDRFAASCSLQLILYQSAYSIMLINKYSYGSSGYDPSKLSTMTAEDALEILKNLLAAGSVASDASGSGASEAVTKAYDSIKSQPGSTDQEKISAYVQANH